MKRQCTRHYKIIPIQKALKEFAGLPANRLQVRQYMGISADEAQRIKDNRHRWITNDYPLAYEGWRRSDCARWFAREYPGRTLSRSACVGCPFHSAAEWVAVSKTDPDLFADACELDEKLRAMMLTSPERRVYSQVYLHRRRKPLAQAVALDTVEIRVPGKVRPRRWLGQRMRRALRCVTMPDVRARRRRQRQRDQRKAGRRRSVNVAWRYLSVGSLLGGLVAGLAVVAVIRTIGVDEIGNTWKMVSLASGLTAGAIVGGYLGLSRFSRTNLTS